MALPKYSSKHMDSIRNDDENVSSLILGSATGHCNRLCIIERPLHSPHPECIGIKCNILNNSNNTGRLSVSTLDSFGPDVNSVEFIYQLILITGAVMCKNTVLRRSSVVIVIVNSRRLSSSEQYADPITGGRLNWVEYRENLIAKTTLLLLLHSYGRGHRPTTTTPDSIKQPKQQVMCLAVLGTALLLLFSK